MNYTNHAHGDSILLREDNLWSVWFNVDVDLILLPCLRVETLVHTTKKKSQCSLIVIEILRETSPLQIKTKYVFQVNQNKVIFYQKIMNSTLFMVKALLFASAMFMASVGLVKGTVLGCWRYLLSLKISAAFLTFSTSSEPIGTQPVPWSHFRSAL